MAKNSFAARVLTMLRREFPGRSFRADDLIAPLMIKTRAEKKRLSTALRDHYRAGRLERPERGLYRLPGKSAGTEPLGRDRMWAVLRMRGTVTVSDLVELCGVSKRYASEYLRMLVRNEMVRVIPRQGRRPRRYQLIRRDRVEAPTDEEKSRRLRDRRRRLLEEAAAAIDRARDLVKEARQLEE